MAPAESPRFLVSIEQSRAGFDARLEVADSAGRTFTAPTCDELIDTVALALALALANGSLPDISAPNPPPLASVSEPQEGPTPPAVAQQDTPIASSRPSPGPHRPAFDH